ncbi:Hypothetical protein CINCED_3A024478 [Cinara cedri]|uniref:Uncharacterized protein n=1 Tax=Cinara cedri TaxID=506608 RepID=A0A5E4M0J2_9HEMI|nr:Hypothetical protein CINCED_3A024478 [Cinara cedri]
MDTLMRVSPSRSIGSKLLFNQAFYYVTPKQWNSSKAIFQPKTPNAIIWKTTVSRSKMFSVRMPPKFNSCRFNIQPNLKNFHVNNGNKAECDIINIGLTNRTYESGNINNTSTNQVREKILQPEQITIPSAKKIVGPKSELNSAPFSKKSDVKENKNNDSLAISRIIIRKNGEQLRKTKDEKTSSNDNSQLGEFLNKGKVSADPCNKTTKPSKPNDCSSTAEQKKAPSKGVADSICYNLNDVPPPKTLEKAISPVSACNKNSQESATQKPKTLCIEKKNNSTVDAMSGTKKTENINDNLVAQKPCDIINISPGNRTHKSGVLNNTSKNQAREKLLKPEQITLPSVKNTVCPELELKSTKCPKWSDVKDNKKK